MRKLIWILIILAGLLVASWPVPLQSPHSPGGIQASISLVEYEDICLKIVRDSSLYTQGWDTLVQPRFWQAAMQISPESCLVNIARTRRIVDTLNTRSWALKSDRAKGIYEDSLRKEYGLAARDEIFFTTGRSHFYRFNPLLRSIDKAVNLFIEEQTDPWYAQAILLIESPGRLQFSTEGAYGAFQLMEGVARDMGLKVNKQVDERKDFQKSAVAAAKFLRTVCIPNTRKLCRRWKLPVAEDALWFRLLVMHVYHAGARNVSRVLKKIRPREAGLPLILSLWQNKSRRFGNASQNYSQIVLACMLQLDEVIATQGILCPQEYLSYP